eukprot:10775064-Prorocentrum_lima.AAC.1
MEHGTSGIEIIPSAQGYEPSVPGLELVIASRLTVLPPQGQHDPRWGCCCGRRHVSTHADERCG